MADNGAIRVLTINSGSSSLKWSLYHIGSTETRVFSGSLERIGLRGGAWHVRDADGKTLVDEGREFPDHDAALKTLLDWLEQHFPGRPVDAVGHRVVHGGPTYTEPHLVTPELLETLGEIVRLAPEHLPHELKAIDTIRRLFPTMKQVACFDTAFHRHMPEVAQRIPMPRSLWHEGVLRYGFHGLSYEYVISKLREIAGQEAADGRVLIVAPRQRRQHGRGSRRHRHRYDDGADAGRRTDDGHALRRPRSGHHRLLAPGEGTQPVDHRLSGEPAIGSDRRLRQQFRHARSAGSRGRRPTRRPGRRDVLLSGAEIRRRDGFHARRARYVRFYRGSRHQCSPKSAGESAPAWNSWASTSTPPATRPTPRSSAPTKVR